jgi:hypothetical protein
MSRLILLLLAPGLSPAAWAGEAIYRTELYRAAAESNINQRYTIESVAVAGVEIDEAKLPPTLRRRLTALIGRHCDVGLLEDLASDLRHELHFREVSHRLLRGSAPDRVRVDFDVIRKPVDVSISRLTFRSGEGFTGEAAASASAGQNAFSAAAVSNADDLTEKFSGFRARYQYNQLGSDRVRFGLGLAMYADQWNSATRVAAEGSHFDLYRSRRDISPELTFVVAKPLTISIGASFEHLEAAQPGLASSAANALTAEARYAQRIRGETVQQSVAGVYEVRAGTAALGSDYSYARHSISVRYEIRSGRQSAADEFGAGLISGEAPLFERFTLGNSSTLRGWDHYTLDPLGADRVVHNSLTYGYQLGERTAEIFYDAGAVWNSAHPAQPRHALGVGYRQGIFVLMLAFPVVAGKCEPVFMAGMNY